MKKLLIGVLITALSVSTAMASNYADKLDSVERELLSDMFAVFKNSKIPRDKLYNKTYIYFFCLNNSMRVNIRDDDMLFHTFSKSARELKQNNPKLYEHAILSSMETINSIYLHDAYINGYVLYYPENYKFSDNALDNGNGDIYEQSSIISALSINANTCSDVHIKETYDVK